MNREEIYRAMELEKIIMYDEFRAKLDKLELNELEARWTGVLELDKEHQMTKRSSKSFIRVPSCISFFAAFQNVFVPWLYYRTQQVL